MRLWHEQIIHLLPKNQLLGQHRECCALRGNGWNKKHKTVDYVFTYSPYNLFIYHSKIMDEMEKRGYTVSREWRDKNYRGQKVILILKKQLYLPQFIKNIMMNIYLSV